MKNPDKTKFIYRDALWGGADLVGLGVASFSHVQGVHYQNLTEIDDYTKVVEAGEMPVKRAFRTSEDERMIREFILQMKLGHVDSAYFGEKFGVNILERFVTQLEELREEGLLEVVEGSIVLHRDGLLCVDNLLQAFFLAHHKTDRIV